MIEHDYLREESKGPEVVSEDSLIQSFASSQSYMKRNRVVTKTSSVKSEFKKPGKLGREKKEEK